MHGGNLVWASALAGCSPSAILDFSASISPLGPPQSAIAAIQTHLSDLRAYPDPDYSHLRQVLGDFHQLPPDWVLPGNGAAELLTWAGRDLSTFQGCYLLTPAFSDYRRSLNAFGSQIIECPIWDWQLAIERLSEQFQPEECGLLLNNPHNPTGQLLTRTSILPWLQRFALVIVDEAFMDFLPPERQESLISQVQEFPNLVIVRSLTKFYSLPGLRLGYAIAHPNHLQRWQQWRDPWAVNVLAAAAAAAAVQDIDFQQQTWEWLEPARQQLATGLAQLPGLQPYSSAANFLLVECQGSSSQLQQQLLQHHQILIRDCLSFPELGDRFFRIAVRSQPENDRLLEALTEVLGQSHSVSHDSDATVFPKADSDLETP